MATQQPVGVPLVRRQRQIGELEGPFEGTFPVDFQAAQQIRCYPVHIGRYRDPAGQLRGGHLQRHRMPPARLAQLPQCGFFGLGALPH